MPVYYYINPAYGEYIAIFVFFAALVVIFAAWFVNLVDFESKKTCKYCMSRIDSEASICPHCGSKL